MAPQPIPLRPSTNIASLVYDPDTLDLDVTFARGSTYRYSQVPQGLVDGFSQADSPGRYFRFRLLNQYVSERLS